MAAIATKQQIPVTQGDIDELFEIESELMGNVESAARHYAEKTYYCGSIVSGAGAQLINQRYALSYARMLLTRLSKGDFTSQPTLAQLNGLQGDIGVFLDLEKIVKGEIKRLPNVFLRYAKLAEDGAQQALVPHPFSRTPSKVVRQQRSRELELHAQWRRRQLAAIRAFIKEYKAELAA